ncbi:uncharacterized protein LOC134245611, partial [Saccostrea cucullata]|uniref:uncharacterized protein LOC134245611 n=1 Tax=Saccostrea cuccullata TaxID=36930 RepID=UPI002ED14677
FPFELHEFVACRHNSECISWCHNDQAECSHGHCSNCHGGSQSECSTDDDCKSHCSDGKHPYCSHFFGTRCQCFDCTDDSHCSCPPGQIGKCHKEVTYVNFHITSHICECQGQTITSAPTTTALPSAPLACKDIKISVIESIAENIHVEDSRASLCSGSNKHQSSEAYVIHKCNATERTSWMKGLSVKSDCLTIPAYTPISTFSGQNDMSGFFVQCTDSGHGLKIAAQTCSHTPMILTLNDTTTPRMSDFFTILQHL